MFFLVHDSHPILRWFLFPVQGPWFSLQLRVFHIISSQNDGFPKQWWTMVNHGEPLWWFWYFIHHHNLQQEPWTMQRWLSQHGRFTMISASRIFFRNGWLNIWDIPKSQGSRGLELASGKLSQFAKWKITTAIVGKSTISMGWIGFNSSVTNYQRVPLYRGMNRIFLLNTIHPWLLIVSH